MVVHETGPIETVGLAAYRVIYETRLDGVVFKKPGGPVTAANPAACALLGMTEEQILRRPARPRRPALDHRPGPAGPDGHDQRHGAAAPGGRLAARVPGDLAAVP